MKSTVSTNAKSRKHDPKEISDLLSQRVTEIVKKYAPDGKRDGIEWVALNPTRHDDHAGSFKINLVTGLWADFATGDKGDALELVAYLVTGGDRTEAFKWAIDFLNLNEEPPSSTSAASATASGLTVQEYADAKGLDVAFLRTLGLTDYSGASGRYVRIPYFNAEGRVLATRQRHALNGSSKFFWNKGDKPELYGLNRLADARAQGFVIICEGESDCHTLWQAGFPAVGLPGASNWREARDAVHLAGIDKVYVVHEGDAGGDSVLSWLAKSEVRHRALILKFTPPLKDPSSLHLNDRQAFTAAMNSRLSDAVAWSDIDGRRASQERQSALSACQGIADAPDILALFRDSLKRTGLVGEDRNASILFLALTSRLLNKPVSVVVKGPSSGGKSFMVDCVLGHFPDDAFIFITGMSERALVYMEDDIAHRHIIIAEACGSAGEMQDYLMRTLLSEGRLEWRIAEKTTEGIRERVISKEGPTGLILTTTKVRLHPENETRMLSLLSNDTREQTRAVLRAVTRRDEARKENREDWKALQTWLAHGERRVVLPFADALAELVAVDAVRVRRDFNMLLSLVQAHALLHRANREQDAEGRIVATLPDYDVVRGLVCDLIAEGISATVPPTIREAVLAVAELTRDGPVAIQAVASKLKLDRTSAGRRLSAAAKAGFVVNEEVRRGREARYLLGEPMPEDKPVLPTVEQLEDACHFGGRGDVYPPETHCTAAHPQSATANLCSNAVRLEGIKIPPPPSPVSDKIEVSEFAEVDL